MSTHNIGFYEEISKIISELSSNTHLICSSVDVGKHFIKDLHTKVNPNLHRICRILIDTFSTDSMEN